MPEIFLIKPFLAIILIAISSSLLGVFVLWKKLTYFGDSLSHSILLGLVFSTIFSVSQIWALVSFAIIFALLLNFILENRYFSKDTIIAVASYFCIALAVLINDIWIKNFNFSAYIFGDILTVGDSEIQALAVISLITIIFTIFAFNKILLININQDLAKTSGIKIEFWNLLFLILLALVIALSVKIIGVFLMVALLILPAAIARIFSISAKQMMILSLMISIIVSALSFNIASNYDLTISSTIIVIFSVIFILSLAIFR